MKAKCGYRDDGPGYKLDVNGTTAVTSLLVGGTQWLSYNGGTNYLRLPTYIPNGTTGGPCNCF